MMKRLTYLIVAVLFGMMIFPLGSTFAQKSQSLPKVPITYSGDTDQAIGRRAQWIEGAKKEGPLVWWFNLNPSEASQIIAEFTKIYPFVKVDYWRGQDTERDTKIETDHAAGRLTADIITTGSELNFPRWRKIGIIEKFVDIIPGIKNINKDLYSRFGDWAIPGNQAIVPQYNTKLVSTAEAPKNWQDLLDPKWKGKIGLTTDLKVWYVFALCEGGWGIEKTEEFLKKLKRQQPIWAPGHTAGHNLLIAGEYRIMAEGYLYHVWRSQEKGAQVDWIRARPIPITGPSISLVKKAPHPNGARLFLEWLFSPQGLVIYEAVTRKGAAFPGAGTRMAKALDGLPLLFRTEELSLKVVELGLEKKFADILGVTPGRD